jgi:1-deoxy-D-xylulose-5-phosphate reductoisomerase
VIGVSLLGATGSIGRSTLEVIRRHPDRFRVVALTAHRSTGELQALVDEFDPRLAVVSHGETWSEWDAEATGGSAWNGGRAAVLEAATHPEADVVVNALVGAAGLEPTLAALQAGKRLALANKESLVAGGALVQAAAREGGGTLVPVDSEHSAILQCLAGAGTERVSRLILTASGGPFRGRSRDEMAAVTPRQALRHPTWDMGAKISIDSATLANKALEVIEAHMLYGLDYAAIEAVVHPQSIIHSMVEFVDGSVLAQVGYPTMELPILYALTWPDRLEDRGVERFDPVAAGSLTFEAVDSDAFPLFALGVEAGRRGGAAPAAFNAGNEIAVAAFLEERVGFLQMAAVVEAAMDAVSEHAIEDLDAVREADARARAAAGSAVRRLNGTRKGT